MNRQDNRVLLRKVRGPKMRLAGFPPLEPLCAAFATIGATAVRKAFDTTVEVDVVGYEAIRHGAFLQRLNAPTTIFLLDFPAIRGHGLVRAHPELLSRVLTVSLATTGADDRSMTPIDISIYGRFVDLILRAFGDAVAEVCGRNKLGRAVRGQFETSPGMVRVAPGRALVFVIKLGFKIGDQTDFAGLDLVLPLATLETIKDDLSETVLPDETVLETWERSMREQVLELPLQTDCVIDLGDFNVGELSRLRQGELLELPPDAMNSVELRVQTAAGEIAFARGRLGANGRHKAIRLVDDPSEEFLEPLRGIVGSVSA